MRRLVPTAIIALTSLGLAAGAHASSRLAYVTGSANPHVWIAHANGRHAVRLGPGLTPLLSPDGSAVAASLIVPKAAALAIYRRGKAANHYFDLSKTSAMPLAWSPDSRYLAVDQIGTSIKGKASGLVIIDTRTGKVRKIASGSICGASFAPTRPDRLVYGRARGKYTCFTGRENIFTVRATGADRRRLTHDGRSGNPVWGAGEIAFDKATPRKNAPIFQVWTMHTDGTHRRQITHTKVPPLLEGLVPLAFSSRGNRLLAGYEGEDTFQTWTISFPSGRTRQLKVHGRSVVPYGIAHSGASILIGVGAFEASPSKGKVETIPFGGGHGRVLVWHGADASWNR